MRKEIFDKIDKYEDKKLFYSELCETGKRFLGLGLGWTTGLLYYVRFEELNKRAIEFILFGFCAIGISEFIACRYSIKRDQCDDEIGKLEKRLEEGR